MTGRDTGLKRDVVIDSVRYVLHDERGALQWRVPETAEEVPGRSGDFVTESWLEGGHLGMGETEKASEAGYYFSENMDASQKGWIRLSPQVITVTSVTMLDATNAVFFGEEDPNTIVYVYVTYREDANKTTSIKIDTRNNTKKLCAASGTETEFDHVTANAADPTRPVRYSGKIYVPLAGTTSRVENMRELTTCSAPDSDDVWSNNDTATKGFYGFTAYQEGSDPMMLRARHPALAEKYSGTNPKTNADWTTTAINIGDHVEVGADVGVSGRTPWIATRWGLFVFDGTRAMLRAPVQRDKVPEPGAGLGTFSQGDRIFYPHGHLWRIRGETALPVGPDNIEGYKDVGISNVPKDLIHRNGAVSEGKWFYSVYGEDSANVYILAGRLREGGRALGASDAEIVWHTLIRRTNRIRGLAILPDNNNRKRLWWTEPADDQVCHIVLGFDGAPSSGTQRGDASTPFTYTFPETDFGLPNVLKEFHRVDVVTENWPDAADAPLQVQYALDGATSFTNLGSTITSATLSKRFFTPSVNGYRIRFRYSITTGASYVPANDDPRIRSMTAYALPRPDKADIFKATINATESAALDSRSHKGVRDTLKALENADPVTVKDIYGDTATVQVFAVSDLRSYYDEGRGAYALINVFMREVPTS